MDFALLFIQTLNGVQLGLLLFLVASGLTLVFGILDFVNLAHGSLYLLGGYIGYVTADITGFWLLAFSSRPSSLSSLASSPSDNCKSSSSLSVSSPASFSWTSAS